MACLNMHNNENQAQIYNTMGPRISFSNDFFTDPQQQHTTNKLENYSYREAPVSSDFEFSILNNTMISADQIFCKGKLLPSKGNCNKAPTTIRDELLARDDDDYVDVSPTITKGTSRWKERFGLKRSNVKKSEKWTEGALERIDEMKTTTHMVYEDVFANFKGSF